jgi:hypothetical protein
VKKGETCCGKLAKTVLANQREGKNAEFRQSQNTAYRLNLQSFVRRMKLRVAQFFWDEIYPGLEPGINPAESHTRYQEGQTNPHYQVL